MSKITSKARNALPEAKFALPEERKYPVDTKARAANAKARASQQVKKGNLSEGAKAKIDAKANKILDKGKSKEEKPKAKHTMNAIKTLRGVRK
jgi:hypothetical protein